MAGNDGAGSVYAVAMRVARLAADGTTPAGANNLYVTDALIKIDFNPEIEVGPEAMVKNAQGIPCVVAKAHDAIKRIAMAVDICTPDPELTELLAGGVVLTDVASSLTAPTLTATPSTTGGTFAAGTRFYKITVTDPDGESTAAAEVSAVTTGSTGSVGLSWTPVPGANGYKIYRGNATNTEELLATIAGGSVAAFTDTGLATHGGSVPVSNTTAGPGTVGYAYPSLLSDAKPYGVSIEAWSRAFINGSQAAVNPYFHWVWPKVFLALGARTLDVNPIGTPLSGWAEENPNWGNGPDNGWNLDSSRSVFYRRESTFPSPSIGYQSTAAQV